MIIRTDDSDFSELIILMTDTAAAILKLAQVAMVTGMKLISKPKHSWDSA